ncbi:MAG TPA: cysteine dioxygenase family protein [Rhodanobacteraceae bacterium]|nr:cysteine dioxygenase family protein [Rhodanobacteraceae bacterium]
MPTINFPGSNTLIQTLDDAVACGDLPAITDQLRHGLCRLIRDRGVQLPDCVYHPLPGHYARRELYRSAQYGYAVVAMTWGPGQGTPIHDHAGMWCVEGVWHGELEITQYELVEQDEPRLCFRPVGSIQAGAGSAGSLIPPHEYHAIRNPSDSDVCVSLHIYSGPMTTCSIFTPLKESWYRREQRELALDLVA